MWGACDWFVHEKLPFDYKDYNLLMNFFEIKNNKMLQNYTKTIKKAVKVNKKSS